MERHPPAATARCFQLVGELWKESGARKTKSRSASDLMLLHWLNGLSSEVQFWSKAKKKKSLDQEILFSKQQWEIWEWLKTTEDGWRAGWTLNSLLPETPGIFYQHSLFLGIWNLTLYVQRSVLSTLYILQNPEMVLISDDDSQLRWKDQASVTKKSNQATSILTHQHQDVLFSLKQKSILQNKSFQ